MIKVMYYIGTNDKDTLQRELDDISFTKVFDNVFKDYTIQNAYGRFTNKNGQVTLERTFIVTTFIDNYIEITVNKLKLLIQKNCSILKETLNQESILVEVCKPEIMFL